MIALWLLRCGCVCVIGGPLDTLPRTPHQPELITEVVPARGHPWYGRPRRWRWLEARMRDSTVCLTPLRVRPDTTPPRGGWTYVALTRPRR
jgi:hypothetical protein